MQALDREPTLLKSGINMEPVKVCFTPDAMELNRVQTAFSKVRPRPSMGLAILLGILFVVQGVLNLSLHRELFGCMQILLGVCYVPLNGIIQRATLLQARPAAKIELTIDDDGITVADPLTQIPWKRIIAVRDVGEAFVATRMYGKGIPILKRALPDGGNALWASLDAKLTASRYLVRGTDSRLTISNSAARR